MVARPFPGGSGFGQVAGQLVGKAGEPTGCADRVRAAPGHEDEAEHEEAEPFHDVRAPFATVFAAHG